ncbi:MAG: hypothetical protein U0703_06290 [Anaerolineae bacterium]
MANLTTLPMYSAVNPTGIVGSTPPRISPGLNQPHWMPTMMINNRAIT